MTLRNRIALVVPGLLCLFSLNSAAQAPAIPADVSPLYVVTYVESKPTARDETAALLKTYRDASRAAAGNLRSLVVQRPRRPGQFVIVAAWKDKSAWDAHTAATQTREFRDKVNALRNAPADDRFHNSLAVGPLDIAPAPGAVYLVSHVDVVGARKDDAVIALKTLAETRRNAGGNVRYEVLQQTNRPNHFTVFEVWRSREAFEAQSMSAPMRGFRDTLNGMTGALYDERLYEILD